MSGIFLQLLTQPADVDVDHLWLAGVLGAPDARQQVVYRDDAPGFQCQRVKHIKLAGGEPHSSPAHGHGVRRWVDRQVAHHHRHRSPRRCRRWRSPPQHGLDAGQQHVYVKGLGDVVISA
jgi:hypothetical protein